jgi:hypothetical protein
VMETVSPFRPDLRATMPGFTLEERRRVGIVMHYRLAVEALDSTDGSTCVIVARNQQGALVGSWPRTIPPMEAGRSKMMDGSVVFPPLVTDLSSTGTNVGVVCWPAESHL